jgi:autotransporter-associated beta strand protein
MLAPDLRAQSTLYWGTEVDANWNTITANWKNTPEGATDQVWMNTSDAVFAGTGVTIYLTEDVTARSLTFQGSGYILEGMALTLAGGTGVIDTGSGSQTISSAILGSSGLTKEGSGTLHTSANYYSGGTTLNAGTIIGHATNAYGSGTVTLASGNVAALFKASAIFGETVTNDFVVSSGTGTATLGSVTDVDNPGQFFRYTGSVTLNRATTLVDGGTDTTGRTTFDGVISGNVGTLTIDGGRVTMAGTNTFVGDVVVTNGSTFQITSVGNQILPLATNVHLSDSGKLGIVGDTTIGGLSGGSGSTARIATGAFANATLSVGANNANTTFAGAITDSEDSALSLTKVGSGTLTLSGASTYSGTTTVAAGTLVVNGSLDGTAAVNVLDGATLGGSGTIRGLTTLAEGAHLAPGDSLGTLTFTNGLTLSGGSFLDFQLGTVSDLIRVSGVILSGPTSGLVTLNLDGVAGFTSATYTLIDFGSASPVNLDLSDFTFGNTIPGYTYNLELSNNLLQVTATSAIPEPSTYATLFGVGALGLALWRRRRAGFARILRY